MQSGAFLLCRSSLKDALSLNGTRAAGAEFFYVVQTQMPWLRALLVLVKCVPIARRHYQFHTYVYDN